MTEPATDTQTFPLRPAAAADIRDVARLWADAFPGKRSVGDRIRMLETGGRYGGLESVIVAEAPDAGIVGACKIYRMTEHIAGAAMPMMGLAAVAVTPSHRRRGLGARLTAEAVRAAADRGDVVSVLYPFRPDYYRRLGWGLVGALHEHRFHTRALAPSGDARHVRAAALDADAAEIAACYRRIAERSNGPIDRDRHVWAYRLTGEELGVRPLDAEAVWTGRAEADVRPVVFDDGGVTGYALLRYLDDGSPHEHTLEVRELLAEDARAYRGLLGHIAAQHDQWPLCRYSARPDERFDDYLADPRPPRPHDARSLYFPTARVVRGPMLRLVDVPGALRLRRYFDAGAAAAPEAAFTVRVTDELRPENDGPWRIRVAEDGSAEVADADASAPDPSSPESGDGSDIGAALVTDPPTLARIFAGEIPPTVAAGQGKARVDGDGALLDRAFATRERFWLLDEF